MIVAPATLSRSNRRASQHLPSPKVCLSGRDHWIFRSSRKQPFTKQLKFTARVEDKDGLPHRRSLQDRPQQLGPAISDLGVLDVFRVLEVLQAQVLLLTRFPYLTDEQRTDILRDTALPAGYALLDGNTWDGWGRLNMYAAVHGDARFFRAVRNATLPSRETMPH